MPPPPERDEADPLRTVPPREFVRARTALAAALEKKGQAAEARRIRQLKRPSPVVWALNAAAGQSRAIGELADTVDRLRRAQLGQGDLRAAVERYRAALEPVIRAATDRLREAGGRISPALERRLQATLLAAITDRRLRGELAGGRLTEEYAEPGFEVMTGGPGAAEFLRKAPPARRTKAERRRQEAAGKAQKAAGRQAQRQIKSLDSAATRKERAATSADRKVEALRATLREQERQAQLLRTAANEARAAHRSALERDRPGRSP